MENHLLSPSSNPFLISLSNPHLNLFHSPLNPSHIHASKKGKPFFLPFSNSAQHLPIFPPSPGQPNQPTTLSFLHSPLAQPPFLAKQRRLRPSSLLLVSPARYSLHHKAHLMLAHLLFPHPRLEAQQRRRPIHTRGPASLPRACAARRPSHGPRKPILQPLQAQRAPTPNPSGSTRFQATAAATHVSPRASCPRRPLPSVQCTPRVPRYGR